MAPPLPDLGFVGRGVVQAMRDEPTIGGLALLAERQHRPATARVGECCGEQRICRFGDHLLVRIECSLAEASDEAGTERGHGATDLVGAVVGAAREAEVLETRQRVRERGTVARANSETEIAGELGELDAKSLGVSRKLAGKAAVAERPGRAEEGEPAPFEIGVVRRKGERVAPLGRAGHRADAQLALESRTAGVDRAHERSPCASTYAVVSGRKTISAPCW